MSEGFFSIGKLEEGDLGVASDVLREGFAEVFRTLFGKVPGGKHEGDRCASRFFRPKTVSVGLRDDHNVLQGVMFLQVAGTRGLCGPLALRPAYDTRIAARALITAALLGGIRLGCKRIESVTFPQSATHFTSHFNFGDPLFPIPYVVKDATRSAKGGRGNPHVKMVPLSSLGEAERMARVAEMSSITNEFSPGFDLGIDAVHAAEHELGETYLAMLDDRVSGFAICHTTPKSEAFRDDEILIKHAYVAGQDKPAQEIFTAILDHAERLAREGGHRAVGLMASSGRRTMLRTLLDRDYVVEELHQHWATQCPQAGERIRSMGNDLGFVRESHFGTSELR